MTVIESEKAIKVDVRSLCLLPVYISTVCFRSDTNICYGQPIERIQKYIKAQDNAMISALLTKAM